MFFGLGRLWSLVFGLWSLVFGLWSLVFGLWSLVVCLLSLSLSWSFAFVFALSRLAFVLAKRFLKAANAGKSPILRVSSSAPALALKKTKVLSSCVLGLGFGAKVFVRLDSLSCLYRLFVFRLDGLFFSH